MPPPIRHDQRVWVRKVDGDMHIVAEQPQLRLYPANLAELVACVEWARDAPEGGIARARGVGSHWAMSHAGVTEGFMIETATPVHERDGDQTAARLNKLLSHVIPACFDQQAEDFFMRQFVPPFDPTIMPAHKEICLAHAEAGMRVHELYAALDTTGPPAQGSFADVMKRKGAVGDYSGPWALETMGGAGGQTIGGVLSTSTHGGDQDFSSIGDAVVAIHLVDANGEQHWMERSVLRLGTMPIKLMDENKLRGVYPGIRYHPASDEMVNAVLAGSGRMGIIYSVVLRVVRQFALEQNFGESDWNTVRNWIFNKYNPTFFPPTRFVRVDVNLYGGFWHPSDRKCYIITRVKRELAAAGNPDPTGRKERGLNPGKSMPLGKSAGFFTDPCHSDNYVRQALDDLQKGLLDLREKAMLTWAACAAIIVFPLTPPPIRTAALAAQASAAGTIAFTIVWYVNIELVKAILPNTMRFGDTIAAVANFCAHTHLQPIYRCIYEFVSAQEHDPDPPFTPAISYAQMDEHDYLNIACNNPGDSIEFFMDADSPKIRDFVDLLIQRVEELGEGKVTGEDEVIGGYLCLRFMSQTQSLLGTQLWPRTVSFEFAGLSEVDGTDPLIARIEEDSKAFDTVIHWGQRNNRVMADIEKWWSPAPGGKLDRWREVLSQLTDHGRYATFSTPSSVAKGLEITKPRIQIFSVLPTAGCANEGVEVGWEARSNPPETEAFLEQTWLSGGTVRDPLGALSDIRTVRLGKGRSKFRLVLERVLNGILYTDTQEIEVHGYEDGDTQKYVFTAYERPVQNLNRWYAEINLNSGYVSDTLKVTAIELIRSGGSAWRMRNAETGEILFPVGVTKQALAAPPIFNRNWQFFSDAAVGTGQTAPTIEIIFTMTCAP